MPPVENRRIEALATYGVVFRVGGSVVLRAVSAERLERRACDIFAFFE